MIITISGMVGSGKSTVAKIIANKLGYGYVSIGDFRRQKAKELGLSINEYNKKGEADFSTDEEADNYLITFRDKKNFIIDSRLGFHFIPNSFKIFLSVSEEEGANRVRERHKEISSVIEAEKQARERNNSDTLRYDKYYCLSNWQDKIHYDSFIDTTDKSIQEVVDLILRDLSEIKT